MNSIAAFPKRATVLIFIASLAACGGGGSSVTATATAPAAPVSAPSTLVNTVPAANYTGRSSSAFALLNAERSKCGFGVVAQNAALDAAAASHVDYLLANPGDLRHTQTPGKPGFTGVNPLDRAAAKGYVGTVSEGGAGIPPSQQGTSAIFSLLSGPYHLSDILNNYRDIGMSFGSGMNLGNGVLTDVFFATYGYSTGVRPQMGSADVSTYPCGGTSGVWEALFGEVPNPVPGRDLGANPIGTPVLIRVREGNVLVVKTASMLQVSNGAVIPLMATVTAANDPHKLFKAHEAYFAPNAPLLQNSQYQVTITGTNNGVDFSRTFIFTTGARG